MEKQEARKQIYTVKQVNGYIRQILDGDFILRSLSVKGEISNCKYHSSGHIYFSLKDESSLISCVMFASSASGLKFRLEDGKQVVVTGNISVYEVSGRYQLYAKKVEEEGRGDLFLKFEELKSKLAEAGYFAAEYKKTIPAFASRIGVVTSETGAVIRDIFHVASRRNPYVQILLYPAKVQGEGAAETIVAGIKTLDKSGVDVIIIGRGGGSIEDLWAFNEEAVAKAVFECTTPVISAVGHETDYTIADFVADLRAPTPSAAAELAVFEYAAFEAELEDFKTRMLHFLETKIRKAENRTENYRIKIAGLSPQYVLMQKQQRLDELQDILGTQMEQKLTEAKDHLKEADTAVREHMESCLKDCRMRLALISERLSGLSPLTRLQQGYAFVSMKEKPVRSVKQITINDKITVDFTDGRADAVITAVES